MAPLLDCDPEEARDDATGLCGPETDVRGPHISRIWILDRENELCRAHRPVWTGGRAPPRRMRPEEYVLRSRGRGREGPVVIASLRCSGMQLSFFFSFFCGWVQMPDFFSRNQLVHGISLTRRRGEVRLGRRSGG